MGLLDRVFRRRVRDASLVDGPTRAALDCRVASANTAVSPVSGARAAIVRATLLAQKSHHGGKGGGVITRFEVLGRAVFGPDALILDAGGPTIHVPTADLRLGLIEDAEDGELIGRLPDALAPLAARAPSDVLLAYREAFLLHGQDVVLEATLERTTAAGGGYRDAPAAQGDLRVLPDDRVVVRER